MAVCAECQKKLAGKPPEPRVIKCEICYGDKETEIPGAIICKECAELSDFCELCKESIDDY